MLQSLKMRFHRLSYWIYFAKFFAKYMLAYVSLILVAQSNDSSIDFIVLKYLAEVMIH